MTIEIRIEGMTCAHCVGAVTRALRNVPGVDNAEVSLERRQAVVSGEADPAALIAAIAEEGYTASPISRSTDSSASR